MLREQGVVFYVGAVYMVKFKVLICKGVIFKRL